MRTYFLALLLLGFIAVAQLAAQERVLDGHRSSVLAVAFAPNGKVLASCSRDGTIKLWDALTGKMERTLTEHKGDVYCVVFSPMGNMLASGGADKIVRLWNARSGKVIQAFDGHTAIVRSVNFAPDQKTLVSAGVDMTIRFWDLPTGKWKQSLTGHTARVMTVVYSHDGKMLASASSDGTARLWDAETGKAMGVLEGHDGGLECVAFSPDGKVLASSGQDGTVRLWDVATRKVRHIMKGHVGEVDAVAYSPDGATVASGCKDKTIKLWDAQTGNLRRTVTGHTGRVESLGFSPKGETLATGGGGGGDSSVRLWKLNDAKEQRAPDATPKQGRTAIERGLSFVQADAVKWRKERDCATCHHGTLTVWALSEAKAQGYPVDAAALADMAKWTKERLKDIEKPRDTRPGWSMVNSPAVYLAVMAQAVPKQDALSANELKQIAGHLLRHQEADGSWAWSSAPAKNRPPPFFESDEVVTMLAYMALGTHVPKDSKEKSPERDGRDKAAVWLAKNKPNETTQAAAFRLLLKFRAGESAKILEPEIAQFLQLQNKDGGWSQVKERPSDAYATGQALYVLSLAGVKNDLSEIQRGVAFLVASQKEDGSWPMVRRGHPGVTPGPFLVPITYFGSTWATLGLMRSVPK